MKIFTSNGKWANVAGDAGFEDDILPGWINIGVGCLTVLIFILNIVL